MNNATSVSTKKLLVTGAAGFIGFHLANRLIGEGYEVVGLDNINDYYDPALKYARIAEAGINKEKVSWNELVHSKKYQGYRFIRMDLEVAEGLMALFEKERFDYVVNLAAQAGVRYSLENPRAYINSNILGFFNLLEACRQYPVDHLVFASSSSVYGNNTKVPFSETDPVDHPVSIYAATKKSNELMAHTYSQLYQIPTTGLRFFTVYGPWGRPDMAYFSFSEAILKGETIRVFNHGDMERDFTYIDDIIEGVVRVLLSRQESGRDEKALYRLYNIGNNKPVPLLHFIGLLEELWDRKANLEMLPMQAGEVERTYADIEALQKDHDFAPDTDLKAGLEKFVEWYRANKDRIE